jgi:hypothetical protein
LQDWALVKVKCDEVWHTHGFEGVLCLEHIKVVR